MSESDDDATTGEHCSKCGEWIRPQFRFIDMEHSPDKMTCMACLMIGVTNKDLERISDNLKKSQK